MRTASATLGASEVTRVALPGKLEGPSCSRLIAAPGAVSAVSTVGSVHVTCESFIGAVHVARAGTGVLSMATHGTAIGIDVTSSVKASSPTGSTGRTAGSKSASR